MEENELVFSDTKIKDNKKVKYYTITEKGEFLLDYIKNSYLTIRKNNRGSEFFNEFFNVE